MLLEIIGAFILLPIFIILDCLARYESKKGAQMTTHKEYKEPPKRKDIFK